MSDSVDRVFAHALQTVRKIPKTGSARPPAEDRLRLYGLYKQSMEGDVDGVMDRPGGFGEEARAEKEKWDAWHAQSGLMKTEAKRRYIATLIETMHKYASGTQEARELVTELEFVWDQVRSNRTSISAASSPPALLQQAEMGLISPNPFGEEEGEEESGVETDRGGRRWRRRVEEALAKMATEVAALRETMEAERKDRRRTKLNWVLNVVAAAGRHVLVEMVFWGLVWLWMRRKGDTEAQGALKMVAMYVKERVAEIWFGGKQIARRRQ